MSERSHISMAADPAQRRYRRWVNEVLVEDRPTNASENADVDAALAARRRDTNRTILLDRAQAAIAANSASLATAASIEGRAVAFTNTQRDDALRFLAGRVIELSKQNNALIRLVVAATRSDALDVTE